MNFSVLEERFFFSGASFLSAFFPEPTGADTLGYITSKSSKDALSGSSL